MSTRFFRPKTFDKAIVNNNGSFIETNLIEDGNGDVRLFVIYMECR